MSSIHVWPGRPPDVAPGPIQQPETAQPSAAENEGSMAARKHLSHSAKTRERIKTSMLINRLQSFVEGTVELNAAQVSAALGLIKKTVPDLSSVSLEGPGENGEHLHTVTGALEWQPPQ